MHTNVTIRERAVNPLIPLIGETGAKNSLLPYRPTAFNSSQEIERFTPLVTKTMSKTRAAALSLQEFCERMTLLSQLEVPCIVYIANPAVEQSCSGVIRRIERGDERLGLLGDDLALHLRTQNIESIRLVNNPASDNGAMAVEIYNTAGALIVRIFGIQDRVGAAVWQDVMANPSLCVA